MSRKKISTPKRRKPARSKGLYIIGGVVLLAVVVVVALIAADSRPVDAGSYVTVEKQEWPMADGKALGAADAPVVVREFSDFQCPYCRQFHANIQDRLVEEYVTSGKVRFEYQHYIVIDGNVGGTESRNAAQASECAAEQGAFWDYKNMLFANQRGEGTGAFTDPRLKAFAEALGLDSQKFNSCLNSSRAANNVTADEARGRALGVRGTPALYVNDQPVQNPLDYASVKAAIDAALASADQ